jgi:FKBP-type peptidyl-prolyl cis-trans isomerase
MSHAAARNPRRALVLATGAALALTAAMLQACSRDAEEASEEAAEAADVAEAAPESPAEAVPEAAPDAAQEQVDPLEYNLALSRQFLEENAQRDTVVVTDNGLQYEVLEDVSGGAAPTASDYVCVDYTGTLPDGSEFDSSRSPGRTPIAFSLGEVVPGWTQGLQLMDEGDRYRLFLPPELAYGEPGRPGIPPNAALVFDVHLHRVLAPDEAAQARNPAWNCVDGSMAGAADDAGADAAPEAPAQ